LILFLPKCGFVLDYIEGPRHLGTKFLKLDFLNDLLRINYDIHRTFDPFYILRDGGTDSPLDTVASRRLSKGPSDGDPDPRVLTCPCL
jgi:hypothetical protein